MQASISRWIGDLGSEEAAVRTRAAEQLRLEGEQALLELEKTAAGNSTAAGRARRLAERIRADLTVKAREADDAVLASPPPELNSLPAGHWALVAEGRLLATGPTREAVLSGGGSERARHRYLWRAGEEVASRNVELGSLAGGDFGLPVLKALGTGLLLESPEGGEPVTLGGSAPEGWEEEAVALEEADALGLRLARWEIPSRVTVRSRVGAGVLAVAWRARALARSADGARSMEVAVWALPDRDVLTEEKGRPPPPPPSLPGERRP